MVQKIFVVQFREDKKLETELYASAAGAADRMIELDVGGELEKEHVQKLLEQGHTVFMAGGEIVDENWLDKNRVTDWIQGFPQLVNP
jgi:3-keto-L-gulonate-6-phosphate decarboxylase